MLPADHREKWKVGYRVVQGTLEMLILKTLALEPMHGYGVATLIEQVRQDVFRVNPGSLLPALARMERAGLGQLWSLKSLRPLPVRRYRLTA
jgi:PadR family transcriptional regulator PadR